MVDDLQGVLQASPDAVLIVDEEGIIQQANRNVPDVLGYVPHELEGKVVEELLLEKDREHHVQFRQEYMDDPEPRPMGSDLELYALHADGNSIPVEISLGPIRQDGEPYVVATISDISERKRREHELERQNERLEEFASVVSHDLRSPLSVAEGRLQLAQLECDSEHLDAIERTLGRMEVLIEDLLTLSREGELVDEFEPVDLPTLAEQSWQNIRTEDATLVTEAGGTIRADRRRLQQLVENLLRNAVEHGGGDVTVVVEDFDDGFYIEDNGSGLPTDHRDRIFQRGYSTSADGTGFGLAIAEQIAKAHDWQIRATNGEKSGARFMITGVDFASTEGL